MSSKGHWGGLRQEEYNLVWESLIKEMVEGVASGLVDLYIKGTFARESFAISRIWLTPGGTVSLASRIQKIRKYFI